MGRKRRNLFLGRIRIDGVAILAQQKNLGPILGAAFYKEWLYAESGGGDRNRTCDILNANQVLYQLSYAPTGCERNVRQKVVEKLAATTI